MGQMRPMGALANASPISPIGLIGRIGLIGLISLAPTLHSQPSTLNSQLSTLSSLVSRLSSLKTQLSRPPAYASERGGRCVKWSLRQSDTSVCGTPPHRS